MKKTIKRIKKVKVHHFQFCTVEEIEKTEVKIVKERINRQVEEDLVLKKKKSSMC